MNTGGGGDLIETWRGICLAAAISMMSMVGANEARSGAMLVSSRGALLPDDSIDWGQLGPDSTGVAGSSEVTSTNGLGATVSTDDPSGLLRVDEGLSWTGNFTADDHIINNNGFSEYALTSRSRRRSAVPARRFSSTTKVRSQRPSRHSQGTRAAAVPIQGEPISETVIRERR
jgi:hypothetical protein